MQVRSVEFQESFARGPVEQGRQYQVMQKEPDLASDLAGRVVNEQRLLDQSRPVLATGVEGKVVKPEERTTPQNRRLKQKDGQQKKEDTPIASGTSSDPRKRTGGNLDLTV